MKSGLCHRIAIAGVLALAGACGVPATAGAGGDTPKPLPAVSKRPVYGPGLGDGDFQIAPPYANAPELTPRDGVPKGTVTRFTMESSDSKIYTGIAKTAPGAVVPY